MTTSDTSKSRTVPAGPGKKVPAGLGRMVPAGPGKKVPAGPGIGQWRTYDVTDGLVDPEVGVVFQDREGNLWFGTDGGLSRYDGEHFTTFTARDGLADDQVHSIFQDQEVARLLPEALALLHAYEWPGNVRELEHVVQRAVIVCPGPAIRAEDILLESGRESAAGPLTPEEYERRYLREALERAGWVIRGPSGAAALLGIPESTLRSRMKKLGVARG